MNNKINITNIVMHYKKILMKRLSEGHSERQIEITLKDMCETVLLNKEILTKNHTKYNNLENIYNGGQLECDFDDDLDQTYTHKNTSDYDSFDDWD